MGLDLLLVEVSRSHSDTPHLVDFSGRVIGPQRGPFLATQNTHKRQISVPMGGFEAAVLANEQLHTHAIYRAATGLGVIVASSVKFGTASYNDCKLVVTSR